MLPVMIPVTAIHLSAVGSGRLEGRREFVGDYADAAGSDFSGYW